MEQQSLQVEEKDILVSDVNAAKENTEAKEKNQGKHYSDISWKDLKQEGNDLFAQQDFEGAVTFYTKALELSTLEHTLYSNRSAALCILGHYKDALQDATKCIEINPNFARGYLRKCVALNGLNRYKEAMEMAQEGYKLRGSDRICKDCVSQWLVAIQTLLKEKIEGIQQELDFIFPKEFVVISDEYLSLLVDVFVAYANSTSEASIEAMTLHLSRSFQELNRVLKLFGHSSNPCGTEWVRALCCASRLDPSSLRVPPEYVTLTLSKSDQLATWLNEEVDHTLYPVLCPIFNLAVMAIRVRFTYLDFLSIDQHVIEVGCRACLPLFEKSLLSAPICAEQHIEIYNTLLSAISVSNKSFNEDEIQHLIGKLQALVEQSSHCNPDVVENAKMSIGIARTRLGQDPGLGDMPFKQIFMSKSSIEDVLSFIEANEKNLKSLLKVPIEDQLPDCALRDSQIIMSCTGVMLKAGMIERATEIFKLGESVTFSILQRQLLLQSFTLDTASVAFFTMQGNVLLHAKVFLGINNTLLADVIIRWKCILSELRALLMQSGLGAKYLATFKALQDLQLKKKEPLSLMGDQLLQCAEEHQEEVHQHMKTKGRILLDILFQQKAEDVQSYLNPGQIILEYCPADSEISICNREGDIEKESDDLLLVLQPDEAPVIKLVDISEIMKYASTCITQSGSETIEMCKLLIPVEIQDIICSSHVYQIIFCPDSCLSQISLDLLSLNTGEQIGNKCTVIHLSAARELLRKSALAILHKPFSVRKMIKMQESGIKHGNTLGAEHRIDVAVCPNFDDISQTQSSTQATKPLSKECIIFADPNYDLERVEKCDEGILEKMFASFSLLFLKPTHTTSLACPLPVTREEAREVQDTLATSENPLSSRCFFGNDVTVSTVLQVDSPYVLHFSTHGFSQPLTNYGYRGTFCDDTKCGILLAGANTYHHGDLSKVVPAAGAGVLTALAVMGMNLHNTSLVYLSTCSSAQGPSMTSGESINSLAEAFRVAGAKTVIATLWPVFDSEAKLLTVYFYQEACKTGVRPSQALALAKKKLQESGYHWIVWTSFICIGEDIPLF